jgi:cellulose synthase/poly-beta-1,6-N-acetylglucosamine synthase-like glycosyltransferase
MIGAKLAFWACFLLIAYTYFLYPILLFQIYVLAQVRRDWNFHSKRVDRRTRNLSSEALPAVSMVIPAFNEEAHLAEKIANLHTINYPAGKLEVIFVSDGATDGTNEILKARAEPEWRLIILPERGGKANALNQAVRQARNDILIFSDACTLFSPEALQKLARHFSDPRIGVVCGSLQFRGTAESKLTEGIYWKYESMLRLMEARLGATLTASGAIYALRRECYLPLDSDTLIEDFVIPMKARGAGYKVLYDPEVTATEFAASTVEGEFARRVRLAVGSFRALGTLLCVRLDPMTYLAFISHKVLRWLVPFLLIGLGLSNAWIGGHGFFGITLTAQICFYACAYLGFFAHNNPRPQRILLLGYYLAAMNAAFLVGFVRVALRRDQAIWQKVN